MQFVKHRHSLSCRQISLTIKSDKRANIVEVLTEQFTKEGELVGGGL